MSDANPSSAGSRILNVVIIGCGRIAGGYDENHSDDLVRSHVKAYGLHPGFKVIACVDPDPERRRAFMDVWHIDRGFSCLEDTIRDAVPMDVASVCSPTAHHADALNRLLDADIAAVLCEKPLTDNLRASRELVRRYGDRGVPLAVNYMRRWTPEFTALKRRLDAGEWGALQAITAVYTKGLKNNGSHMIDLLMHLCGGLEPGVHIREQIDWVAADPTVDAVLHTESGAPVYLLGLDARHYTCFECTLFMQNGIVSIEESGYRIRRRRSTTDPRYPSQNHVEPGGWQDTDLGRSLYAVVENLYQSVVNRAPLASTGATALATQLVVEGVLSGRRND